MQSWKKRLLKWMQLNKWWIITGLLLTMWGIHAAYLRRGYFGTGSEYIFLFLPFIRPVAIEVYKGSVDIFSELLNDIREWVEE